MSVSQGTINLQDGNVGNYGDIIKHAALLQLSKYFFSLDGHKTYLDTHCYLTRSQLANHNWTNEVACLIQHYPLYQEYAHLQQTYIDRGEYLCSSGIVLQYSGNAELLLSESNVQTRLALQQQLLEYDARVTVKDDMMQWHEHITGNNNLFVLLDPFKLTDENWAAVTLSLAKGLSEMGRGLMLTFDYDKSTEQPIWPKAPTGWSGPVARFDQAPYHLAAYSTPQIKHEVMQMLSPLGWAA